MIKWLLRKPTSDEIINLLLAWRVWIIGAVIGAFVASVVYLISPPKYRTDATIIVDLNVEQILDYETPDRNQNYFLERESSKLVELAWSDDVMARVAQETGLSVMILRSDVLQLGQPSDGGWKFYANSDDPELARKAASIWAKTFYEYAAVESEIALEMLSLQSKIESERALGNDISALTAQYDLLQKDSLGIDPYLDFGEVHVEDLVVSRSIPIGNFVFLGSLLGILSFSLGVLFFYREG